MKKQNNILTCIKQILSIIFVSILFYACTDEDVVRNADIEEGIPVEVNIQFLTSGMNKIATRSLTDAEEYNINDMYILVFNESGERIYTDGGLYTKGASENGFLVEEHTSGSNKGSLTLSTTSGKKRIFAIANVKSNQLNGKGDDWLLNELNTGVSSVTELEALTLQMDVSKSIDMDRVSANMVMSGAWDCGITNTPTGYCEILPNTAIISGTLKLVRLDSKITFEIHLGSRVTKFEPQEWQVFNVPVVSNVIEQTEDAGGIIDANNYQNSIAFNNQYISEESDPSATGTIKNKYLFTFYQLENLKKSKTYTENGESKHLSEYSMREAEVKNEDGTNSGIYKFVEPFATYVQIKAYMEIRQTDGTTRIANIRAIVHLGGIENAGDKLDCTNFRSKRNKKYTYKVTINDVNDIVTEVKMNEENRPGMEGDVIDSKTEARILDAHYNCFNVGLTYNQVKKMGLLVHSPFDEVSAEYKEGETDTKQPANGIGDYNWVKFKYLGTSKISNNKEILADYTTNASYPNDDSKNNRLNIFELRNDVMQRGKNSQNSTYYYTVFVDEYYYRSVPCNGLNWGSDPKTYWTKFVNQDDRYIMLLYTPQESKDKDSSYGEAQYFIRQKSIQTYYSTTNLTSQKAALGIEHTNESPDLNSGSPVTHDTYNGYYNTYKYVGEKDWKNYVQKASSGAYYADVDNNTFQMETRNKNATAACLSRNRDKNGNGKIDADEIEWYVPTARQLSSIYLGAQSLPSPLFTPPATGQVNSGDKNYHFYTSDGDIIWAEEGCSNGTGTQATQIRCVRNLGLDGDIQYPTSTTYNKVELPYKLIKLSGADNRIVFDMNSVDQLNLRQSPTTTLNFHTNFKETKNMPYYQFELAQNFYEDSKSNGKNPDPWTKYSKTDLCTAYSEKMDKSDKGTWRTPNQRELLIIFNEGSQKMVYDNRNENYGMYSCTYWLYSSSQYVKDQERIFAINADYKNMFLDGVHSANYGGILRCVRDVKINQ